MRRAVTRTTLVVTFALPLVLDWRDAAAQPQATHPRPSTRTPHVARHGVAPTRAAQAAPSHPAHAPATRAAAHPPPRPRPTTRVALQEQPSQADEATPTTMAPELDELRSLRVDLEALRQRPTPASAAEVEQLRAEVRGLAAAQRDLEKRLPVSAASPVVPGPPSIDRSYATAAVLLAGGALGWLVSRLGQRRRDRRQRIRL